MADDADARISTFRRRSPRHILREEPVVATDVDVDAAVIPLPISPPIPPRPTLVDGPTSPLCW